MLGFPFLIAGVRGPIQPYLQTAWGRTAFWVVLLVLGYVLSKMRVRLRSVYGIAEWLTGAAACWVGAQHVAAAPDEHLPVALALAGGVYLMVDGLDNVTKGRKEDKAASAVPPKNVVAPT
jgi:hypothetical protein